jgi:hypothetical protein
MNHKTHNVNNVTAEVKKLPDYVFVQRHDHFGQQLLVFFLIMRFDFIK